MISGGICNLKFLPSDRSMQTKIKTGDTIAAIATPPGVGAIGIVRLSGADAFGIGDRVFRGKTILSSAPGYTIHHGWVHDSAGKPIDEVLVSVFRSPHSYTGEDLVEIGCHGGWTVTNLVLQQVLRAGSRLA